MLHGNPLALRRAGRFRTGANGAPAVRWRALVELAQLTAGSPDFPPLEAGELITTGTITAAWPVSAGETWRAEYGELGVAPLTLGLL